MAGFWVLASGFWLLAFLALLRLFVSVFMVTLWLSGRTVGREGEGEGAGAIPIYCWDLSSVCVGGCVG